MGAGVLLFLLTASHSDTLSALSTAADAWCQAAILFIFPARTQSPPAFLLCSQFYTFCADLSTFISFFFFIFISFPGFQLQTPKSKLLWYLAPKWWPWGQDFTYLIIFVGFWGFSLRLCCVVVMSWSVKIARLWGWGHRGTRAVVTSQTQQTTDRLKYPNFNYTAL